jgi:hypothetical protein
MKIEPINMNDQQMGQQMEHWSEANWLEDLFEKNIKTLYGQSYSPFMFIEPNKSPLHNDTIPSLKIIENINRRGFLTLDSQPSLFEEKYMKYLDRNYEPNYNVKINKRDKKVIGGKNYYRCHHFQKSYCSGWIYQSILEDLKSKIEPSYKLFFYDYSTKEMKDGYENLTYYEFYNRIYYPTNFFDIKSCAKSYLYLLGEEIDDHIIEEIKFEMIYIEIIDLDYNTNKNIYQDILSCLE